METERLPSGVFFSFPQRIASIEAYEVDQLQQPERLPSPPLALPAQEERYFRRKQNAVGAGVLDGGEEGCRYLPLLEVSMNIKVVATTSWTQLTQTFSNL